MYSNPSKLERIKALKNGKGFPYLINEASKIFGNPMLMHDLDYKSIVYTENHVTDDLLWNDFVANNGHSDEAIEFLKDESLIDVVASSKTIVLLSSANMKYDRLFGKIYNKYSVLVAAVDIVACYKPLEEDDYEAYEEFCKILAKEANRDKYYLDYGDVYQERLICKLIETEIEDKKLYPAHVEIIYDGLKSNLYLAAVDIAHVDPEYANIAYYKGLLKKTQPEYKYAIYANHILIIISTDDPILDVKKDLMRLNRLFQKNNIYAGISSCFDNLFELKKYYYEALSALKNGLEITDQRIFLYEQFR